jgi:hypothetical protein
MSGCAALTEINLDDNRKYEEVGGEYVEVGGFTTAAGLEQFCSSPPPNLTKLSMDSCGFQGMCLGQPVRRLTRCFVLSDLPQSIGGLSSLEELSVSGKELKELPSTIGSLSKLKKQRVCGCALSGRVYFWCFCITNATTNALFRALRAAPVDRGPLVVGGTARQWQQGAQRAAVNNRLTLEAEEAVRVQLCTDR